MFGPDRPILAIAPHGIDGERVPASIEEMAADRLPLILEAQPRGPYVLGGHCNGALVAFETARLLVNAGHRVDLVVMIDPVVVSVRRLARLLLLALDLTKRTTGAAPDLRRHSLALVWFRLQEIEKTTRRWKKSWVKRWNAIRLGLRRRRPPVFVCGTSHGPNGGIRSDGAWACRGPPVSKKQRHWRPAQPSPR